MESKRVPEKITIGLYTTVEGEEGWDALVSSQIENIRKIHDGFKGAASARGNPAPQIVLSALVVPNWTEADKNSTNGYGGAAYEEKKKRFLKKLQDELTKQKLGDIVLEDFYTDTSQVEKAYLDHLEAKGSIADMVKTHAVIKNQAVKHLQMDSNTQIPSYQAFYDGTFGRKDLPNPPGVMLNASVYTSEYIAAQNKIAYTTPKSAFAEQLFNVHLTYCANHAQDHLKKIKILPEKKVKQIQFIQETSW